MTDVVLYSGGVESTYCMLKSPVDALCMMFDYGQPYAKEEREVVLANARRLLTIHKASWFTDKEHQSMSWPFRNELMVVNAVRVLRATRIWFGCRAPLLLFDNHHDANRQFCNRLEKDIGIEIVTPALMLPEFVSKRRIARLDPTVRTFSSKGYKRDGFVAGLQG